MTLETQPEPKGQGRSWQLAAYLVLGLALVGSLPSVLRVYHVFETGVTWEQVPFALQQRALWQRNEMCASSPGEQASFQSNEGAAQTGRHAGTPRRLETFNGMKVRLQACWNGDVLVRTVRDTGRGRAVWIADDGFAIEQAGLSIAGSAVAQSLASDRSAGPVDTFDIMCQERTGNARIVRIVSIEGDCTRETINIFTGEVESVEPVACDASCQPEAE